MQPQGHVQVLMNLLDFGLNPQMALDAPRWQWTKDKHFITEPRFDSKIIEELKEKGHEIDVSDNDFSYGRGQMILKLDNGAYIGACESRTDSNIACY